MTTSTTFIENVNYLAGLDNSLAMSLSMDKTNIVLVQGSTYNAVATISMYNRTTCSTETTSISSVSINSTNLDAFLISIKTQIELAYPVIMTHSVVASAVTLQHLTAGMTLSGSGYYLREFSISISLATDVKYTIVSKLINPIELIPAISALDATTLANISNVALNKTNITSVAQQVVPNMATILASPANAATAAAAAASMHTLSVAAVTDVATSVAYDPTLNKITFHLVQGTQGIQGIQGPQGIQGATGTSLNIKGTDTSANIYLKVAVANDFWIASDTLHGFVYNGLVWIDTGLVQGPQGAQGIQGVQGAQGVQGLAGPTGLTGPTGAAGKGISTVLRTTGTGAAGTTDIYTITYTDATTSTFSVYNGANGTGAVTGVTATAPVMSSGGAAPVISMAAATAIADGYMTSVYASKLDGIAAGATANTGTVTSVAMTVPVGLAIAGTPITTTGTFAITMAAGYAIPTSASQTNWDTAFTQTRQWDGGATGLVAATGRTSLGATTIGANMFTLLNPTAITFPRFNADNTVSALDAATFRTAIGAGTSSTAGTVTNVTGDAIISVATGTTTPALTHSVADGFMHVPATGTLNNGKVLTAGATAGSLSWTTAGTGVTDHTLLTNIGTMTHAQLETSLAGKATTAVATTLANGLMSSTDKTKLDGITGSGGGMTPYTFTATAGQTAFVTTGLTLLATPLVFLNDALQQITATYTVTGLTVTFVNPRVVNDTVVIVG